MKKLILLRGLPGSGKSTMAKILGNGANQSHHEADMYFMQNGTYQFDGSKLKDAHMWCKDSVRKNMERDFNTIVVSNTFTQEWEMEAYYELAKEHGYTVFSLVVENRHGGQNEHGVPADKLEQMKNRFELKLI